MEELPRRIPSAGPLSATVHRLRRLRTRRNPGMQRSTLRSFIDRIETFQLALDPEDRGEAEEWYIPGRKEFELVVEVGPIEMLPRYIPPENGKTVVWYHKTIIIPERKLDKEYKINFARACYTTKVWGNGKLLTDVDGRTVHTSGFSSFSYDLSPALDENGRIELVVRVENSDDPTFCRGKQASSLNAREGIWYSHATGLWGQVTLEEVSANRLRSDVTGYADPFTGQVRLQPITYIKTGGEYLLEVVVDGPDEKRVVSYRQYLKLEPGQFQHDLRFVVPKPQPWSPESPTLYEVEVNLRQEDRWLDRVYFKVGFRSLTVRDNQILLNGKPCYMDGVLYQPFHGDSYTLDNDQLEAELHYTRRITGSNLLRIHIAGADPLPLSIADELGLLVWVEVPSPHISNEASRANHRRELDTILRQIDSHPCVAIVSLYNESWGCEDIGEDSDAGRETRKYIKNSYQYVKNQRPDLLVIDNDGWEHICEGGKLIATDWLTLHIYTNKFENWQHDLDNIASLAAPGNPRFKKLTGKTAVVGDDYTYQGELPIVISEWGGFGAIYGGPAAEQEKFNLIRRYKTALRKAETYIAGDCYTQLGDVENETNGLLDKELNRLKDENFMLGSTGLLSMD